MEEQEPGADDLRRPNRLEEDEPHAVECRSSKRVWCPVWKDKEGNEIVLLGKQYCADNREDAQMILCGMMIVEAVILGLKKHDLRELDEANCPHIRGFMGNSPVIIVGGPAFEAVGEVAA